MEELKQVEETIWEIAWDGYYPYCKKCYFEPELADVIEFGLPEYCPKCGRKMTNADELNSFRKKGDQ